jgi:hypothetical protein
MGVWAAMILRANMIPTIWEAPLFYMQGVLYARDKQYPAYVSQQIDDSFTN